MAGDKHSQKKKTKFEENIKKLNKQKDIQQKNYNKCKIKYQNINELQWLNLNKKLSNLKANLKFLISFLKVLKRKSLKLTRINNMLNLNKILSNM